jgi:hypothetical protein
MSDLHFPLALLAYGSGDGWLLTRGDAILVWACDSRGRAKMKEEGVTEDLIASKLEPAFWEQVESTKGSRREDALAWAAGCATGWYVPNFDGHRKTLNDANSYVRDLEAAGGTKSPFVRVPSTFAAEAFAWGKTPLGMTYREFSVLCAVYSCTGEYDCGIVRREQVRLRQTGAWNEKTLAKLETPQQRIETGNFYDPPKAQPRLPLPQLTLDQIRYTMDELEGRGLFHRVVAPNKRDTFCSRHLQGKEFVDKVVLNQRRRARKADRAKTQAMLNAALAKEP